jgi:hypothetical protein
VIAGIAEQFSLHLRAIEVPNSAPPEHLPMRLVKTIGRYFESGILSQEFSPEPALSFEISAEQPPEDPVLIQVLSQLVFYGAIVSLGENRFRLAHTFAPLFTLPLRKGRPIALNRVLGRADRPTSQQVLLEEHQTND